MSNINLFSQIISRLDRSQFSKLVKERKTDKHQKGYNSWTHLVSMLFCQFAKSQSVRDISNGLRSATGNLNHLGIQKAPTRPRLQRGCYGIAFTNANLLTLPHKNRCYLRQRSAVVWMIIVANI